MKELPQFSSAKFSPSIQPSIKNSKMYLGYVMHFRQEGDSL